MDTMHPAGMGTPMRRSTDWNKYKPFHKAALLILFMAACLVLYISYLLFWPSHPFIVTHQPVKIETPVVKAGGNVIWTIEFCMKTSREFDAARYLERDDGEEVPLQFHIPLSYSVGCHTQQRINPLPVETIGGRYRLKIIDTVAVNVLRRDSVEFYSDWFTVTENTKIKN